MRFSISDLLIISLFVALGLAMNIYEFTGRRMSNSDFIYDSTEFGFPFAYKAVCGELMHRTDGPHRIDERGIPPIPPSGFLYDPSYNNSWALVGNIVIWSALLLVVLVVRRKVANRAC